MNAKNEAFKQAKNTETKLELRVACQKHFKKQRAGKRLKGLEKREVSVHCTHEISTQCNTHMTHHVRTYSPSDL